MKVVKFIVWLLVGVVVGFAIAGLIVVLFTDTTLSEFADNMLLIGGSKVAVTALIGMAVSVLSFVVAVAVLVPVHEAGHLVAGLLTGYRFVSFRVFNLTFIKADGRIRVKKFAVAGTGGQCLLMPHDLPLEKIPARWYNAGGVLANIFVLLLLLPLFWLNLHPLALSILAIFCLTDFFMILMNGIPMKLNGISNDGYNIIYQNRNLLSKRAIVLQLRTNALIQSGVRPKDMPDGWFEWRTDIDFKNPMEVSIPLMHASRLVDQLMWEEAFDEFSELFTHRADIMQLYVDEIACELAFCAMATGRKEKAVELLDVNLRKYIDAYKGVMSSKQRILCAIALYIDNDRAMAEEIYRTLSASQEKYLLQGEVKSDLAIMKKMLGHE